MGKRKAKMGAAARKQNTLTACCQGPANVGGEQVCSASRERELARECAKELPQRNLVASQLRAKQEAVHVGRSGQTHACLNLRRLQGRCCENAPRGAVSEFPTEPDAYGRVGFAKPHEQGLRTPVFTCIVVIVKKKTEKQ